VVETVLARRPGRWKSCTTADSESSSGEEACFSRSRPVKTEDPLIARAPPRQAFVIDSGFATLRRHSSGKSKSQPLATVNRAVMWDRSLVRLRVLGIF
jgi:hypothetical protein